MNLWKNNGRKFLLALMAGMALYAAPVYATPDPGSNAPEGYMRDENGRLFQVTFDMRKRFYIGSLWAPSFDNNDSDLSRVGFDFGFRTYHYNSYREKRYRFKLLEGNVTMAPVDFDILLFGYDLGINRKEPAFWITTFIGKPRRWDLGADIGWGMRLLRMNYHPLLSDNYIDLENVNFYVSWELHHARKLANYVRFAIGPAYGQLLTGEEGKSARHSIYPKAALEGEFQLGRTGRHHMGFELSGEARPYFDEIRNLYYRGTGRAFYEAVVLAINDQPISLYLEGKAQYREDIPDAPEPWEYRGMAGLRFSFWAPVLKR